MANLLVIIGLLGIVSNFHGIDDPEELSTQAQQSFHDGDYDKAIDLWTQAGQLFYDRQVWRS